MKMHDLLCVLVYHPRDTKRRCNFEKIRHQPFVKTSHPFILDRFLGDIPNTSIPCRMHTGALCLKSGTEHVERIDD